VPCNSSLKRTSVIIAVPGRLGRRIRRMRVDHDPGPEAA
jgi:hypothetical protein